MSQGSSFPRHVRQTKYGVVSGVDDSAHSGTYFWKGIPFAKPPVGDLRWRAPEEPEAWSEPLITSSFRPASVQLGLLHGPGRNNTYDATIASSLGEAVGSEDCLYLNIWRPATAEVNLPVIVFLHGGSNVTGFTADPVYDGAALARTVQAVVVTVNYRLGVFGWLDVPQLKTGSDPLGDSGNFGILDQLLALRFIQANIVQFGGDPGRVTGMGQSAGAMDLYALLTSPVVVQASLPLLQGAVLMSGGLALPSELPPHCIPTLMPLAYTQAQGRALLHALLMADGHATSDATAEAFVSARTDTQVAAYLRAKTPEAILRQVLTRLTPAGMGFSSLIPEGSVVARSPISAIAAGAYLHVPMLISTTKDETKLFPQFLALSPALGGVPGLIVTDTARFNLMMGFSAEAPSTLTEADLIHPAYLPVTAPGTGFNARMSLLNQLFFLANRDAMLQALITQQSQLWCYEFDWDREPAPWNVVYGAAHAVDLPFVFGNFGPSVFANAINSRENEGGRLALSEAMMGAVGAFARHGDPNHAGLGLPWLVWPSRLVFDASLTDKQLSVRPDSPGMPKALLGHQGA